MQRNVYEILDLIGKAKTKEERISLLRKNASNAFLSVLYHTYNLNIEFYRLDAPKNYKPDHDVGPGLGLSNLHIEHTKFYLFYKIGPLKEKRKDELLLQLLESLETKEAQVVLNMFDHDLKTPGLNLNIVREVFPNLIP